MESLQYNFINRPGVAKAVLQSPTITILIDLFIQFVTDPFPQNLQTNVSHKPEGLES